MRSWYEGRRVLVTGHTGFKGTWLCHWLGRMGARVTGVGLAPGAAFLAAPPPLEQDLRLDVRDRAALATVVAATRPEVVLHMAAEAIVGRAQQAPRETFETNVGGTANLLDALTANVSELRALLVITSDKVYLPPCPADGYQEDSPLGGLGPYAASKASVEHLVRGWPASLPMVTLRAGNVIGAGDRGPGRIAPDCVRAWARDAPVTLRAPQAVRPWQHVLEPCSAYLWCAHQLAHGAPLEAAYNVGPSAQDTVLALVEAMGERWPGARWTCPTPEAGAEDRLVLRTARAAQTLRWRPTWDLARAAQAVIDGERAPELAAHMASAIEAYIADAGGAAWARG